MGRTLIERRGDALAVKLAAAFGATAASVIARLRAEARAEPDTLVAAGFSVDPSRLFSDLEWAAIFEDVAADAVADQVVAGAADAAVAAGANDDVLARAVREHVDAVRAFGPDLGRSVADTVSEAMTRRLTLSETAELVATRSSLATDHARTIARALAPAAANAGMHASFVSAGVAAKVWEAIRDRRTRVDHVLVDGQQAPITGFFTVGGFPARYPGDPGLPPDERINCRCRIAPVAATGARGPATLADATVPELRDLARRLGVPAAGRRDQLVAGIEQARTQVGVAWSARNLLGLSLAAATAGVAGRAAADPELLRERLACAYGSAGCPDR